MTIRTARRGREVRGETCGRRPRCRGAMARVIAGAVALALAPQLLPAQRHGMRTLTREDLTAFADSFFSGYVQRYPAPSLALVVVAADSVLLARGYGFEAIESHRAVDPDSTLFNIASVSKLVTATGVMQLVEEKRLLLDDDVERLLGRPSHVRAPTVTVRHLLTHTSGLDGPFMRDVVATPAALVPLGEYFSEFPPRRGRPPGREIRYSNYGMALAGHLVERVSGEPFDGWVERAVLAPLGMTRSSFRQPPPSPLAARVATAGSGAVPDALLLYPAGSMVSTAADMGRFMRAHLNRGRLGDARVLAESTTRSMHARAFAVHPRVPGVALGFFEGNLGGVRGLFHTGARTHFSLLYLLPGERLGIYVVHAMRQGGEFQSLRTDFVRSFIARYVASASDAVAASSPGSWPGASPGTSPRPGAAQRARRFAGVYRPILLGSSTIERAAWLVTDSRVSAEPDGRLRVRVPGGTVLELNEADSGVYQVTSGPNAGITAGFVLAGAGRGGRDVMALGGGTLDPLSFERLAWYERGTLHAALLAIALLLMGVTAAVAAVGWVVHRVRRRATRANARMDAEAPGAAATWRLAVVGCTLAVLAPLAVGALVLGRTGEDTAAHGLRTALTVGMTILLAAAVAGAATLPLALVAWRRRWWSLGRRVHHTLLAVAIAIALPLLAYYRLLGYWF